MAKTGTRRSISIKGITYQRLKDYCEALGISVSGYVEDLVGERLGPVTDEDRRKFDEAIGARHGKEEPQETEHDELANYVPPIQFF